MKVMIIVLVAIAVAAVLVLFYGGVRPEGDVDDSEEGLGAGFGWLAPSTVLAFEDLEAADGMTCADAETRTLQLGPGQVCSFALEVPSEVRLCASDSTVAIDVTVAGRDYPPQHLDAGDLQCGPRDHPVRIYDADTTVTITCGGVGACVLAVVDD